MRNAMGEYGVSQHKEAAKNASGGSSSSSIVRVGEAIFPNKKKVMMKSVHHNHQHRPFSPFDNDSCGGDGDGPTTYMSFTNHINLVSNWNSNGNSNSGASSVLPPAAAPSVTPLQPFHSSAPNSNNTCATTTFNFNSSAAAAGGMAASLGVPFTNAQWKELERQAMIYKYMMASVPVPPDLLIPPSSSSSHLDGGFNLRLGSSSNTDPEPGRCRRTDGKKWRCSRDVAPNHKYCERHMHRGRPRSRKPVELHTNVNNTNTTCTTTTNNKRPRHEALAFPTPPHVTVAVPNPSTTNSRHAPSSHFLPSTTTSTHPYLQSSLSLRNFHFLPPVSSNKEPRGLEWMLNGDPISLGASNSEWQPLMHNKVGISSELSNPQYLNSFSLYSSGLEQQNRSLPLFLNPLVVPMENLQSEKPGGFIDAWSGESNGNTNNKNSASSIGKLSLPSLDLSMGVHENKGTIGMGLGLMDPADATNTHNNRDTKISLSNWLNPTPHHWVASTPPGGPLAEVLRPSTVTPTNEQTSNPSSPAITHVESNNSPLGTLVSSPSGVLQKTLASLSDSSSNSSPTVASSRTNHNSEMPFLRFGSNQM